ncbi:protein RALF-like 19 [Silene latifolia]|uniref:protein RALF-like 19 n=1 Tax=Silene latifolia TaxID=37657 RepID=UPI003D777122
MATKLWLIALLLALVIAVESTSFDDATWGMTRQSSGDDGLLNTRMCNGRVGDCIGDEEDMLDSESGRRQLARVRRFISNDALRKDRVPCNRRGQSYYYCRGNARANPYRRGCTYITHCARDLH